jgi:beta-lactamase regulating signal transducer with metallopeptidase domain
MGVHPQFYCSRDIGGPVTFGLRRPVILLPDAFLKMGPKLQEAIACHELLHVRRRDWIFTLGEEIVRAIFWFHPVLLRLVERIRLTREQVVDGLVVRWTNARTHYMQALLEMAAMPARPGLAAPSFVRKHHLTERIKLLLKEVSMSRRRLIFSLAAVVVAAIVAGGLAVWYFPLKTGEEVFRAGSGVTAPVVVSRQSRPLRRSGTGGPGRQHQSAGKSRPGT